MARGSERTPTVGMLSRVWKKAWSPWAKRGSGGGIKLGRAGEGGEGLSGRDRGLESSARGNSLVGEWYGSDTIDSNVYIVQILHDDNLKRVAFRCSVLIS